MEEELWYMQQQSRVVQEFRRDIERLWNDEASRAINTRFLNPHEADDKLMLAQMSSQHENLKEADAKLQTADQHAQEANRLSLEAAEFLQYSQQEVDTAYQYYEQYRDHHSAARELLPQIQEAINKANSVCQGVPKQ